MVSVEKFIENFKAGFDNETVEDIFLNGNCFHFSLILKQMYGGLTVYNPHEQHFLTMIEGNYYDITGRVSAPLDEYIWQGVGTTEEDVENNKHFLESVCQMDPLEVEEIESTCVYKM